MSDDSVSSVARNPTVGITVVVMFVIVSSLVVSLFTYGIVGGS